MHLTQPTIPMANMVVKIDKSRTMLNIKADGILPVFNHRNKKYSLNNKYEYKRLKE